MGKLIISLIILGSLVYYVWRPSSPVPSPSPSPTPSVSTTETSLAGAGAKYLPFEVGLLEEYLGTRRLLFFYASWCSTCRPVDAELTARIEELPADLTIIRVNYNDSDTTEAEKELAAKYVVTYQHTFVQIDQNGEVVAKWNGGGVDKIIENLRQ